MSGNNAGSISQDIATTLGQAYTLSFDMAGNPDQAGLKTLLAAGTTSELFAFDSTGKSKGTVAGMGWTTFSMNFVAIATT